MTSIAPPICAVCSHRIGSLLDPKCAAFPAGIPRPILMSEADHRKPFEGDLGIQFSPVDAEADAYAEQLFAPVTAGG